MKKMVLVSVFLLLLVFLLFAVGCPKVDVPITGEESIGLWTAINSNLDEVLKVADRQGEFPEGQPHPFLDGKILVAEEKDKLVNLASQAENFSEFISLLEEEGYTFVKRESEIDNMTFARMSPCAGLCAQKGLVFSSCGEGPIDGARECSSDEMYVGASDICVDERGEGDYKTCCCKEEPMGLWTIYNANQDAVLEVADKPGEFPEGKSHPFLNGKILIAEEEAALVNIATQAENFSEFISLLEEDYELTADENVEITVDCVNTSDGYECTYDVPPYSIISIAWLQVSKADDKLKEQCEADGGKYKCYGFCTDDYERICDFPYKDAGQPCTDNSECQGLCIADEWDCETGCAGTCATYRLDNCDNPTHLTNGVAYFESVLCD